MFDPDAILITQHAVDRYTERRQWGVAPTAPTATDPRTAIRGLLARCCDQAPPLRIKGPLAGYLYKVGELTFVVSSDRQAVVTCYHLSQRPQSKKRRARAARKARAVIA